MHRTFALFRRSTPRHATSALRLTRRSAETLPSTSSLLKKCCFSSETGASGSSPTQEPEETDRPSWSSRPDGPFDEEALSVSEVAIYNEMLKDIQDEPIVLFMKGRPDGPKCGFSKRIVEIMGRHDYQYTSYDVLYHHVLRQGCKHISKWPTIPQLFVKGEFVGGVDIVEEMENAGEFGNLLKESGAALMDKASAPVDPR